MFCVGVEFFIGQNYAVWKACFRVVVLHIFCILSVFRNLKSSAFSFLEAVSIVVKEMLLMFKVSNDVKCAVWLSRDGRVVIARALRLSAGEPVGLLAYKGSNPFPGAILLVNFI